MSDRSEAIERAARELLNQLDVYVTSQPAAYFAVKDALALPAGPDLAAEVAGSATYCGDRLVCINVDVRPGDDYRTMHAVSVRVTVQRVMGVNAEIPQEVGT